MHASSPFFVVFTLALTLPAAAQVQAFPHRQVPHAADSGYIANRDVNHNLVWSHVVRSPGATWLRIYFNDDTTLDGEGFLRLTSLADGHFQLFENWSLRDYRFASSYFNGDAVRVELFAAPFSARSRVRITAFDHGEPLPPQPLSQCGPNDDRIPSTDPRQGRQFPTGCTTWLISKFAGCTAGHCTSNANQTMQFNVPPSTSTGGLNHPPPSDQYPYDGPSLRRLDAGVGSDWAVFATVRNSTHGYYAGERQGAWYTLGQPPASGTIRITGYGTDSNDRVRSQTQQTHTGPLSSRSGTRLCYVVDTEGGNSGSPVIEETSGLAVGIHTHGGCRTSGSGCNSGTAVLLRSDFISAMNLVLGSREAGGYDAIGKGCSGSAGVPSLAAKTTGPEIGKQFHAEATNLPPAGVGVLIFGISDAQWGAAKLPLVLDAIGATGCNLYVSFDNLLPMLAGANGISTWSPYLPNNKGMVGLTFYQQYLSIDAKANQAGFALSNAAKVMVGGLR